MPNYEYKCTQDGSRFELWQEVGAPAPPCPTCGAATKKMFQPPRIIFKGSGFYVTDLRSEQSAAKSQAKETPAASGASEAPTEAQPAATKTDAAKTDAEKSPAEKSDAKTDSTPTS